MLATPIRCASGMPGFWRRSVEEFKRQANIAVKMEGLHQPRKPRPLIQFDSPESIQQCKIMSDKDLGGFTQASLTYQNGRSRTGGAVKEEGIVGDGRENEPGEEPAHVLFKGSISTELPPNKPDIQRSGYAAWRTRDRGYWLFGKLLWDIDPYAFLALRVKSDGRKYFVNIQTESIVPTDLHQHLLPTYTPGQWETVIIPFHSFVRTNYGMVVEPQREMLRQKVRSVGIGLIDRVPGPFELAIADVYATNREPRRSVGREESGFDVDPEDGRGGGMGIMDEIEPRRKRGEAERILI